MTENFLKFKRMAQITRIVKSLFVGGAFGTLLGGIFLILSKLNVIKPPPLYSILVGFLAFLIFGAAFYFIFRTTDKRLAENLDKRFALQEKTQTMIEYQQETDDMFRLQRQDADRALSDIPVKSFNTKHWWVYPVALCIGFSSLVSGFIVKNKRIPIEEVVPFEITAIQIAGIEELIKYVDASEMEEAFRKIISTELKNLLVDLKKATTQTEMRLELTESMAYIQDATYDSSSATEILNALWNTQDPLTQTLAKTLDTSGWTEPDWGDFAEKMLTLRDAFNHQPTEDEEETPNETALLKELRWNLENTAIKIGLALPQSGIVQEDALYIVVDRFVNANETGTAEKRLFGISIIAEALAYITSYDIATTQLDTTFTNITDDFYDVIAQQKINTNVGEYTMTKLATLFLVPLPTFERPDFSKNGGGSGNADTEDKENKPSDGGVGEGATFGSDDLVLNPLTGEYVEYGELLNEYHATMLAKLESGNYTEEQKEIIKKYFKLLYGINEEEGN